MFGSSRAFAAAVLGVSVLSAAAGAQVLSAKAHPSVRITAKVDRQVTTRLPGTHPQFATAEVGARVAASKALPHLRLVLTSSPEQEAALATLMAEQQDKNSPNFHKWLTPETFGQSFGPAQADIAKVTAWLGDQGLGVESVSKSGRIVTFSGSVAQVEAAFNTQIAHVTVKGEPHISNTTDISIPSALAPVVAGVARLNDIFPSVGRGQMKTVKLDGATVKGTPAPLYSGPAADGSTYHYVAPGDVATIYNTTPLTSAGIDGKGQTISVLAQSNIDPTNVDQFRSMFGLSKNSVNIIVVGQDPGLNGDDGEAYLDAEWAGAVATGAKINFLVSAPSFEGGGIDGAATYAVENNSGDIISLSYGGCEFNNGAGYSAFWNTLWEQAAAQGQTAFVSSGDSGAAGCSSSSATYATVSGSFNGYSVNSLGSSAYNVAVGGSMFVDYGSSTYWAPPGTIGTTTPFSSALSYIPEAPLNQGRLSTTYLNDAATATQTGAGIFSAGGGVSIYVGRPAWQTGSGIPTNADAINPYSSTGVATGTNSDGTHRLVPDVVNISAYGHDGTLVCAGTCTNSTDGSLPSVGVFGGTSVATPVQASIQALINQKNGGRQGNILPILYKLANTQYMASTTACQATQGTAATPAVTLPASTCYFHDVVTGSITVPSASSGTAGVGFTAGVGYDEASGLGSMNVANVANNWTTVGLAATTTTFTLSPAILAAHGSTQNLTVKVSATTGSATPTGDVSLIAETASPNGPRVYTLTAGSFSGTVASSTGTVTTTQSNAALPAGNYSVHVHYAGDLNFAASDSPSLPVSIGKETSTTQTTSYALSYSGNSFTHPATSTYTYGNGIYLDTYVIPATDSGVATGSVTYAITRNGAPLPSLTTTLDGVGNTYFYSGASIPAYYLKTNYGALSPGTYVVTTTYSGDSTFNSSTTTNTFTVSALTPAFTLIQPTGITSGGTAVFAARITNPNTSTLPNTTVNATGTITFVDSVNGALGSCTLSGFTLSYTTSYAECQFSTNAITGTGSHTVTATYSGDTNYTTLAKTATFTVGTQTATTTAVVGSAYSNVNGCAITVNCYVSLKATISPTATGTVAFYDGTTYLGSGALSSSAYTLNTYSLTGGAHAITAVYSGSGTFASSTGTATVTVAKATPILAVSGSSTSTYGSPIALGASLQVSPLYFSTQPIQPTGVVNFYYDGTNLIGTGTLVVEPAGYSFTTSISASNIPAGSHSISATYTGDASFAGSTVSYAGGVTVAKLTPTITISSPSTVYNSGTASSVVLTATIPLAANLASPTAQVSFLDGAATLGTVTATYSTSAGGYVATYTATNLARGTHSFTAVLGSDTNYNQATSTPLVVAVNTNNVWIANGNNSVSGFSNAGVGGTPISSGGTGVRIDNVGNVWSLNAGNNSVAEYNNAGTPVGTYFGAGLSSPSALAIDGAGLVWVTNGVTNAGSISVLNANGTAFSSTAYATPPVKTPNSINIDSSGNLWITNAGDYTVVEVIGVATPVITPQATAVKNATPAARP